MPRPKQNPDDILELELRITPPDQKPITNWQVNDDFLELIFFEEGGDTSRLHYHGVIKTKRSKSWIRTWIYNITHAEQHGVNGNAVYFSRKPHDYTHGYIAKHGSCSIRHNVPQTTIDEWINNSNEYRKQKESDRKRKSRTRDDELQSIIKEVESDLQTHRCQRSVDSVVQRILDLCHHQDIRFPMRTQMDAFVLKLMYPYDQYLVRSFFTKSFENIRT